MSFPKKHHYVPVFYLKRWITDDGKLTEFRKFHGTLKHKRVHPQATGFQLELYSIRNYDEQGKRQIIETGIMSPIDNKASDALDFMESSGKPPSDRSHRNAWTGFLLSLIYRSPLRIERLRKKVAENMNSTILETKSIYHQLKRASDPPTFEEYFELHHDSIQEGSLLNLLSNLVGSELVGNSIIKMNWAVIKVAKLRYGFLTCDIPIMLSNGLGHQNSFILLPISPSTIFIAAARNEVIQSFSTQSSRRLEIAINDAIVQQAQELVIGQDSHQFKFIERRFLQSEPPDTDLALHTWEHPLVELQVVR